MYVYLTNPLILHAILGLAKTKIMYFTVHNTYLRNLFCKHGEYN